MSQVVLRIKTTDRIEYSTAGKHEQGFMEFKTHDSYDAAVKYTESTGRIHHVNLKISSEDGMFSQSMSLACFNPDKGSKAVVLKEVSFKYISYNEMGDLI